ncbi:MAG: hypothetical protein BWX73_01784 [Lentisphaerae bacterium ADurb.Bin082]|nr:MAG: hypothetical protein BWX73_01784 [Lentisphaerae bacterium ADurb.Bin082]
MPPKKYVLLVIGAAAFSGMNRTTALPVFLGPRTPVPLIAVNSTNRPGSSLMSNRSVQSLPRASVTTSCKRTFVMSLFSWPLNSVNVPSKASRVRDTVCEILIVTWAQTELVPLSSVSMSLATLRYRSSTDA